MIDKRLDALKDLGYQPFTYIGDTLPRIPDFDLLEISQYQLCKADNKPRLIPRLDPLPGTAG
jgi:hypothetical protein